MLTGIYLILAILDAFCGAHFISCRCRGLYLSSKKCGPISIDDDEEDFDVIADSEDSVAANSEVMQITGAGGGGDDDDQALSTSAMSIDSTVRVY